MRAAIMPRNDNHQLMQQPAAGEPRQVAVTVIACLVILFVFVVIAALF